VSDVVVFENKINLGNEILDRLVSTFQPIPFRSSLSTNQAKYQPTKSVEYWS
jgi:hypothetical protein